MTLFQVNPVNPAPYKYLIEVHHATCLKPSHMKPFLIVHRDLEQLHQVILRATDSREFHFLNHPYTLLLDNAPPLAHSKTTGSIRRKLKLLSLLHKAWSLIEVSRSLQTTGKLYSAHFHLGPVGEERASKLLMDQQRLKLYLLVILF